MDQAVNANPPFTSHLDLSNSSLEVKVVHIKLWYHTRADGACLLDISKVSKISVEDHLDQIADLYVGTKNSYGIKFTGRQNTQYIEVYPKTEIKNDFLSNGVLYEKFNVRLLPFGPTDVLLDNIRTTLERHGKVLDVSLNYDTRKDWFLGSGSAVIQQLKDVSIPSRYGHKSADCDNPKSKKATAIKSKKFKKVRKTSVGLDRPAEPSVGLLKSKWSPQADKETAEDKLGRKEGGQKNKKNTILDINFTKDDDMSTSDENYISGDEDEGDSDASIDYVSDGEIDQPTNPTSDNNDNPVDITLKNFVSSTPAKHSLMDNNGAKISQRTNADVSFRKPDDDNGGYIIQQENNPSLNQSNSNNQ
ncbi:uncharacterized protein BX663DRAFT_552669 [Cokeromyces recurvatus]|uniref:uncharacterized protein n=1 Tax=Cokeromyces recurvatus TaxID=90255 RepID=UPI00221F6065|nr:uncharacterized protein BX663DRAFT_552669 [Cokeromyces recurvatus]KAI7902257.1 hypothetical protein BX663DRAFT_552669 [Cokeromyces recurvatus]